METAEHGVSCLSGIKKEGTMTLIGKKLVPLHLLDFRKTDE